MKTTILTIACIFSSIATYAQDSPYQTVQDPEFPYEPMIINNDLSLTPLPKEEGFVVGIVKFIIKNPHSPYTANGKSINIVVKHDPINGTVINPRDTYTLYKLKEGSNDSAWIFKKTEQQTIPIEVSKVRENIYIVTLNNLEPGEYAWKSRMVNVFCNYFTFRIE